MLETVRNKIVQVRESNKILQAIEGFLQSRWFIVALTAFICLTQTFGLDMVGFIGLALSFVYICIFSKNINPIVPIVCLAIYCVSTQNSPWVETSGMIIGADGAISFGEVATLYYSTFFTVLLCVGIPLLLSAAVFRVLVFGECKKAFTKNSVFIGLAVLSVSFLLSGAFSPSWTWEDLFWGAVQAATYFGVYVFFAACIDKKSFTLDYIANVMLAGLACMIWAVAVMYIRNFHLVNGLSSKWKDLMSYGWGGTNTVGTYIAFTLPACLYKMHTQEKRRWVWSVVLALGMLTALLTLCRSGIVVSALVVMVGLTIAAIRKDTRKHALWTIGVYLGIAGIVALVIWLSGNAEQLLQYFFVKTQADSLNSLSSGRLAIWERHFEHFLKDPVLGGGLLVDFDAWANSGFVQKSGGFAFYGVLAHNLIYQTLSGGGIVGMLALLTHVLTLGKRTAKKHSYARSFLSITLGAFYFLSMLDNIFYMAHFTFLYIAIIVAIEADVKRVTLEKTNERTTDQTEENA